MNHPSPPSRGDALGADEVADARTHAQETTPRTAAVHTLTLTVNGQPLSLEVQVWVTLLDLLRERLHLTGTKKGCDHGQCGACTVLVDGRRINACLSLAVMNEGCEVTTIEGLARDGALHPLQQAFVDEDALQCGYCTPGQICSAQGLIHEAQARSQDEVKELMSGNICRCGAYPQITRAVVRVLGTVPCAPAPVQEAAQ